MAGCALWAREAIKNYIFWKLRKISGDVKNIFEHLFAPMTDGVTETDTVSGLLKTAV